MPLILAVLLVATRAGPPQEGGDDVLGAVERHTVLPRESLIEIARQYDVGYNEIVEANPDVDPFVPPRGFAATIPTAWILPRARAPGTLVVNLSELRLYLFPRARGAPVTFPIGIGDRGATPLGTFQVIGKEVAPTWYPPASIRSEDPDLPALVPPGPENPLGTHALRLSKATILIHGTNRPWCVGRKVSHGCLRLYPEDIPRLFEMVRIGTPVVIVREPVKIGLRAGRVHIEVHEDGAIDVDYAAESERLLAQRDLLRHVDPRKLARAIAERRGIPVDVTAEAP